MILTEPAITVKTKNSRFLSGVDYLGFSDKNRGVLKLSAQSITMPLKSTPEKGNGKGREADGALKRLQKLVVP